jgi:hypothetical protein
MADLLTLFKEASISLIIVVVIAYLARNYIEGWIKNHFSKFENLVKSSLEIKKELREREMTELVEFRVCVEKWEYFLQTGIAEITMKSESSEFEPADFHKRDVELFGSVRVAAVKAAIYLRDQQLEVELLKTISAIRNMYYPLLANTMQRVLELQGQLLPYLARMKQFESGGLKDATIALNADEARIVVDLRHKMSGELKAYAEGLVAQYKPIAEQLYDLKDKINVHIYRPLTSHEINKA